MAQRVNQYWLAVQALRDRVEGRPAGSSAEWQPVAVPLTMDAPERPALLLELDEFLAPEAEAYMAGPRTIRFHAGETEAEYDLRARQRSEF